MGNVSFTKSHPYRQRYLGFTTFSGFEVFRILGFAPTVFGIRNSGFGFWDSEWDSGFGIRPGFWDSKQDSSFGIRPGFGFEF